jgi:hypothetical protein
MPSMGGKTRLERFIIMIGKLLQQQRGQSCATIGSSMKSKALVVVVVVVVVVAVRMIAAVVLSCGVVRSLSCLAMLLSL